MDECRLVILFFLVDVGKSLLVFMKMLFVLRSGSVGGSSRAVVLKILCALVRSFVQFI